MIFNEQEMKSRRQFHEIFCTRFLTTCDKKDALHAESWNSNILYDILHSIYKDNILVPKDIETILHISGMLDRQGEIYFKYCEETPTLGVMVNAMSNFITTKAYVRLKQQIDATSLNSVEVFVRVCCSNYNIPTSKILAAELYEHYLVWCSVKDCLSLSRKAFHKCIAESGITSRKGYLNGNSGIRYYVVRLDMQEVYGIGKPEGTSKEKDQKTSDGEQSIWDVDRTRNEIYAELISTEKRNVSQDEGREDSAASDGGDLSEYDENDFIDQTTDEIISCDDIIPSEDRSADAKNSNIVQPKSLTDFNFSKIGSSAATESTKSGERSFADEDEGRASAGSAIEVDPPSLQDRLMDLPTEIRQNFKLMKITYRIASEHFTFEDFKEGVGVTKDLDALYELFLEYAKQKG